MTGTRNNDIKESCGTVVVDAEFSKALEEGLLGLLTPINLEGEQNFGKANSCLLSDPIHPLLQNDYFFDKKKGRYLVLKAIRR